MKVFQAIFYITCIVGILKSRESKACSVFCADDLKTCRADYNTAANNAIDLLKSIYSKDLLRVSESCDGSTNTLECPTGTGILALHGFYGYIAGHSCCTLKKAGTDTCNTPRNVVMAHTTTACNGKTTCVVPFDYSYYDPCQSTKKVLIIYYMCMAPVTVFG